MSDAPVKRPIDMAMAAWKRLSRKGDVEFTQLLGTFLRAGFVYAGDDAFILAKPIRGDTWWVHLAAGNLARFLELAPYPLKYVAWQRKGQASVRAWRWDDFKRHLMRKERHGLLR